MAPARKGRFARPRGAPRRGAGELESAAMAVLWEAGTPLSAAEVRERLQIRVDAGPDGLAYTTVVTILTRLCEKGVLSRRRDGRAFRFEPVADAAGLAARRLNAVLDSTADRDAVLSRFVEELPDHDERLLRDLLDSRSRAAGTDSD